MDLKLEELYQIIGEKTVIIHKLEQALKAANEKIEIFEKELAKEKETNNAR